MNLWKEFNKLKTAHQVYFSFLLGLTNFTILFYSFVIEEYGIFPSILHFALVFWGIYIVGLKIMGDYHFKPNPGHPQYENLMMLNEANQWVIDVSKVLYEKTGDKRLLKWIK